VRHDREGEPSARKTPAPTSSFWLELALVLVMGGMLVLIVVALVAV
jgi:hypothetical protein